MKDMKDAVVVVTGSASGIGRAMVSRFAADGARVVVADINAQAAEAVAAELMAAGYEAIGLRVDVSSQDSTQAMAESTIARWGGIDVMCANAGTYPYSPLPTMSEDDWDAVMGVNLKGGFLSVKAVLPGMIKQQYGRIVVTSSITGPMTAYTGLTHYAAAKAGVLGFVRSAALELAPHGITVNAVLPGTVRTPGLGEWSDEFRAQAEAAIPVGRMATPEDIANGARFLAAPESGYITGIGLVIDGGQTLPESLSAIAH
jgi:3-oxoacyl-[acyl-carrier protein] reductase